MLICAVVYSLLIAAEEDVLVWVVDKSSTMEG